MLRRTIGCCAVYCLALMAGRATAQPETHIALFWPAAGIGVLWLLRTVTRRELATAVGLIGACAAIGNAATGFAFAPGLTLGIANMAISLLTVLLYRARRADGDRRSTPRHLTDLDTLVRAASAATLATSVFGLLAVLLRGGEVTGAVATAWFVRNLASILVVVGATIGVRPISRSMSPRQVAEAGAIFGSISVLSGWVFGAGQSLPLAFLPLALLIWAGIRLPLPLTAGAGALAAMIPLGLLLAGGGGPFARIDDPALQALVLQGYMLLVALLALTVGTYRTELRSLVSTVRHEHRWSDQLIAHAPNGLLVVRPTGHVAQANPAVGDILHRAPEDLVDIRGDTLDGDPDGTRVLAAVLEGALRAAPESTVAEWVVQTPGGDRLTLSGGARAVPGPAGEIVVLLNVTDVSERSAAERRHAHDAAHDQLTGLPNRRRLEALIAEHHQSAHARPRGALLLIDLDHFKTVNDTRGHAVGDNLLAEIAVVLQRTVGSHGTVGRRGGDEFEVLLPEATLPSAEVLAWSLVAAIGAYGRRTESIHGCVVTASIGIATFRAAHPGGREVEVLADKAMYAAKRMGGNKARSREGPSHRVTPPSTPASSARSRATRRHPKTTGRGVTA